MNIRAGNRNDLAFLQQMLFEAFFLRPDQDRPDYQEFHQDPAFHRVLAGWGRPGDRAVIAEENESPFGAAWYRFWTEEDHSYGFVDAETPELGIGVLADCRSRGVGRALLRALVEAARDEGDRRALPER